MTESTSSDILSRILSGREDEPSPETVQLNCLIYRDDSDLPERTGPEQGDLHEVTQGNVTVQVWESRARIRVRLSSDTRRKLSMTRLARIAMNAILEELNKEAE
jgi:hypothetical protein